MFRLLPLIAIIYAIGTFIWMGVRGPGVSVTDFIVVCFFPLFPLWGRLITNQKLPWFGARAREEIDRTVSVAIGK